MITDVGKGSCTIYAYAEDGTEGTTLSVPAVGTERVVPSVPRFREYGFILHPISSFASRGSCLGGFFPDLTE